MNIEFTNKFEKQIDKIKDKAILSDIKKIVNSVLIAKNIKEIDNLKKIKGKKNAYRIKKGKYRIGIFIEKNSVLFAVFYHRKDIYNFFPLFQLIE